jgi:hypothetical protein
MGRKATVRAARSAISVAHSLIRQGAGAEGSSSVSNAISGRAICTVATTDALERVSHAMMLLANDNARRLQQHLAEAQRVVATRQSRPGIATARARLLRAQADMLADETRQTAAAVEAFGKMCQDAIRCQVSANSKKALTELVKSAPSRVPLFGAVVKAAKEIGRIVKRAESEAKAAADFEKLQTSHIEAMIRAGFALEWLRGVIVMQMRVKRPGKKLPAISWSDAEQRFIQRLRLWNRHLRR